MDFRQIFRFLTNRFTALKLFPSSLIAQGQNPNQSMTKLKAVANIFLSMLPAEKFHSCSYRL